MAVTTQGVTQGATQGATQGTTHMCVARDVIRGREGWRVSCAVAAGQQIVVLAGAVRVRDLCRVG